VSGAEGGATGAAPCRSPAEFSAAAAQCGFVESRQDHKDDPLTTGPLRNELDGAWEMRATDADVAFDGELTVVNSVRLLAKRVSAEEDCSARTCAEMGPCVTKDAMLAVAVSNGGRLVMR
jgi:hypothetical protein